MCAVAPMSCRPQPGSVARHAACPDLPMPLWVTPRWTALPTVFVSWGPAIIYCRELFVDGYDANGNRVYDKVRGGRCVFGLAGAVLKYGRGCTQARQGLCIQLGRTASASPLPHRSYVPPKRRTSAGC